MKQLRAIVLSLLSAFCLAGCTKKNNALDERLFNAITAADVAAVRQAIADGARLDARNEHGETFLMVAVLNDSVEILDILIDAGAKVPPDALVSHVFATENLEIFKRLVDAGADIHAVDGIQSTTLMFAAQFSASPEPVRFLLENGLDANTRDMYGCTALHAAAMKPRPENVALLLEAGADVDAVDSYNQTALMILGAWSGVDQATNTAALLAGAGANVNATNVYGQSILSRMIWNRPPELASFLIQCGADPNGRDTYGNTVLMNLFQWYWHDSEDETNLRRLQVLLDAGADMCATNRAGDTALMVALTHNETSLEMVARLLDAGADVNARNAHGVTPLMHFMAHRHESSRDGEEILTLLLDAGADINAQTYPTAPLKRRGWTALMYATMQGDEYPAASKMLLEAGADASYRETRKAAPPKTMRPRNAFFRVAPLTIIKTPWPMAAM